MPTKTLIAIAAVAFTAQAFAGSAPADAPPSKIPYPIFELDRDWPKEFPNNMIMGDPGGVAVDPATNHVWVVSRQRSVNPEWLGLTKDPKTSVCCSYMPAVAEFTEDGSYVQGWGGPFTPTAD